MNKKTLRTIHRKLAPIMLLPLSLTVITGVIFQAIEVLELDVKKGLLMEIHTGEIFHLEKVYPFLNGLGVIVLIVTGISMINLFPKKKNDQTN
jgi:hypothetical protein